MTKAQATAEVFWTAFQTLPRKEKNAILQRLLKDKQLRQDWGAAVTKSPRPKRSRPSRKYLTARQLASSEIVGMWKDRTDIGDSAEFARQLREKAQRRG